MTQDPSDPSPAGIPTDNPLQPVPAADRIASLDVLRGFAVLGILMVNIQSFAMIDAAYFNPSAFGSLAGANGVVAALTHILGDQKIMTIFSMLFGAGVLLMTRRRDNAGGDSRRLHRRRMTMLLSIGLLHAYLVWHGDILVTYALCGFLIYRFRRRSPAFLITAGLIGIAVASAISFLFGWSMQFWPASQVSVAEDWHPTEAVFMTEVTALRGGLVEQFAHRIPASLEFQTVVFLVWGLWRAGGLMLAGMGLFKLGIFSGERSAAFYRGLVTLAALVGLPIVAWGWYQNVQSGWDVEYSFFFGNQYNYWASLVVSMGWVGLVMLACRSTSLGWLTRPLAAAGRMALSNYLGQSLICTLIFYGHGLGLFGRVDRIGQAGIVAAVWLVQLVVCPLWLGHFRYGPMEWAWRSLTYGRRQPLRH